MSVSPSTRMEHLDFIERISLKLDIWGFFENLSGKYKF